MKIKRLIPFLVLSATAISILVVFVLQIKSSTTITDAIAEKKAKDLHNRIHHICSYNLCFQSLSDAKIMFDSVQHLGLKGSQKKMIKKTYDDFCDDYFDSFSSQCDNPNIIPLVKEYMTVIDTTTQKGREARHIISCVKYKDVNYTQNMSKRKSSYIGVLIRDLFDDSVWRDFENKIIIDYPNMSHCCNLLYQNEINLLNSYKKLHREFQSNYKKAGEAIQSSNNSECNSCWEITGDISFFRNQDPLWSQSEYYRRLSEIQINTSSSSSLWPKK